MAGLAVKRLIQEYQELITSPVESLVAGPKNDDDIFLWEALIMGPPETFYEGGCFRAELKFPKDYPINPPTMKFIPPIWHPNIYPDGTFITFFFSTFIK